MPEEYFKYPHVSSEIKTLGEFINQNNSIAIDFIGKVDQFLKYDGGTGLTNYERIFERYDKDEEKENSTKPNLELYLKFGTTLLIPKSTANTYLAYLAGKQVVITNNFSAFLADKLNELLNDPQYRQIHKVKDLSLGAVQQKYPSQTVYIWCRAIDKLLNISPFVSFLNTSNTENGGNFQLDLAPIICEPDGTGSWNVKKGSLKQYFTDKVKNNYVAHSSLHRVETDGLKRNNFYFHNIISANDILFIRFETLENELQDRTNDNFNVSEIDLAGKNYDMIALVDQNTMSISGNEASVRIQGRDLIKALIDDGCYFFPSAFANGAVLDIFDDKRFLNRIFGKIEDLFAYTERSIDSSIRYVLNKIANTGYVPNKIFQYFKEKSTWILDGENEEEGEGIWSIIKLIIDPSVSNRRLADSSIATDSGSLMNFINKICQQPFVEFFTDTYGDKYHLIVRQPPFNKESYKQLIYGGVTTEGDSESTKELVIDIESGDIISEDLAFSDDDVYSWYRLVPQALYFGEGERISLNYFPAIYFPEYVEIWGSRAMDMIYNYAPYIPITGLDKEKATNYFEQQVYEDIKYLIDCNAYLPFTRKGVITTNGDRRVKRGTTIRHKATGEIFYVDSVTNTFVRQNEMIDRQSIISVSRGMVEKYINDPVFNYFNIINTSINKEFINKDGNLAVKILSSWKVNRDVFDFFVKRNQFKTL